MRLFNLVRARSSDSANFAERVEFYLSLKAKNTKRSYKATISEWVAFLQAKGGDLDHPTEKDVFAYISAMLQKPGEAPRYGDGTPAPCTQATVGRKVTILRGLYKTFPAYRDHETPFEAAYLRLRKSRTGEKRPTEVLSPDQVRALLELTVPGTKTDIRDRAFIAGLFAGALRISEVLALRLQDLREEAGVFFLVLPRTKAGRPDEQPIQPWAASLFELLREQRKAEGGNPGDPLFVAYRGKKEAPGNKPLAVRVGFELFKARLKLAGLPETLSPHSGRATAVTKLLLDGADYGSAKSLLRHESFEMVSRYDKRLKNRLNHPGLKLTFFE